jgi:hypothetical protein
MSDQTETAVPAANFEVQIRDDLSDAAKTWLRSHPEFRLAESLVAFVSEADAHLPRDQFLRLVINRIVEELSAPLRTGASHS